MDAERTEWDVVVIGAGAVGENVADRVVQGGLSAVVVESELVGGECSYWACMPSKALLRSGTALRAAARLGETVPGLPSGIDPAAVLRRRDGFTSEWDDAGQVSWLEEAGIDLIRGRARLVGERRVVVRTTDGEREIRANHAVVMCTGSAAFVPDVPGLREATPWTSREATSASEIPGRLAIIGGGVIGCEMATAYADLGSEVTLLARSSLLGSFEPVAGQRVSDALSRHGVDVRTGVSVQSVRRERAAGSGTVDETTPGNEEQRTGEHPGKVTIELGDGPPVNADEVLVATGRRPRTEDLGLETAGLTGTDWLDVDDTLRVLDGHGGPITWLYAAGDVTGRHLLTHQGKYQARAAGDVIVARAMGHAIDDAPWGRHVATADHATVPQVVFTDPEVASVGLTADAARAAGHPTQVVDHDLGAVAGAALHADGYSGAARLVIDTDREVILGATFVGPDVAELLHAATIAVSAQVPVSRLWHAVPAYPTISEVWLRLLESYGRR